MQKSMQRSRVGIFRTERIRSTPLYPELMFWYVSYYLGVFGTIWLPYENQCKMGRTSAKVRAKKLWRIFTQRMHPIHPHWTLNWCFGAFHTIWVHLGPFGCVMKLGAKWSDLVQKFVPRSRSGIFRNEGTRSTPLDPKLMFFAFRTIWHEVALEFFATKIHPIGPKTNILVHFIQFGCIWDRLVALWNSVENGPN